MSVRLKQMVVLCGIVAFTVVGLTALDKHDERTCRQNPALVAWARLDPEVPLMSMGPFDSPSSEAPDLNDVRSLSVPDICDGVLPW